MAFLEFFNKQKDTENTASINKSSSDQSVCYAIDRNVVNNKLRSSDLEQDNAGYQDKKRNSKSEENIFDKFEFNGGSSSTNCTLNRNKSNFKADDRRHEVSLTQDKSICCCCSITVPVKTAVYLDCKHPLQKLSSTYSS